MKKLKCFKAYDIRGQLGEDLNEDIAYRIGRAYAQYLNCQNVVVGSDARETSEPLKLALAKGLQDSGCNIVDIGMVGTEEIYYATSHLNMDGGIMVTASHNPINFNGMKLVREKSRPISRDTGLDEIKLLAEENKWKENIRFGSYKKKSILKDYAKHLLTYVNVENITPLKIVVNSGNGTAGHVIDELESYFIEAHIPVDFIKIHHQPDASFPNGIPNPLLPENRQVTADAVREHNADMGIAWDGDFDRCFFFDENANFIEGYYIVGLLADAFLKKNSNETIIYDPRVYWNTEEIIKEYGGQPVMSKTGHAFIKERMRIEDAVYGGEMSAHHYFRDFNYCDSGMIPWLLIAELLSLKRVGLSALIKDRIDKFPSSGEINFKVDNASLLLEKIESDYSKLDGATLDHTDGLSVAFPTWRFNIRESNTESLLRLNIESKNDCLLLKNKTNEITQVIKTNNNRLQEQV
ncbi:phosphomannomutase CpsG [Pelagibaculum spongiae]|uniref:phosphomannomutase n=1 Tax=Pelagibaculum spongiae TaxID=2080658 RepID=A0A2V1GV16_9GAMM|nr:phosphomannomutase CpsG [Pelagibaculum spongiae]PVZ70245.1 phosphomannomutase CpsG [Pelagibaculum spongiae]